MRRFQAAPLESWQARRLLYKQSAIAFWLRRKTTLRSAWRSRPTKNIFLFSCFPDSFACRLLHADQCADWNFGEEFAGSVFRQSDAAVRCRIVRHISGVHSKIETTQPHEVWHLHVVNRGTMVALLIGNHKFAALGRITCPASGASGVVHRYAVLDESDLLHPQRNFDSQFVRCRPAAEKNLRGPPVAGLRSNIQCRHFVATR